MKSLTIHQHTKIQDLAEFFNKVGDADRVRGEKLDNGLTRLYVRDRSFLTVIKEHLFEDDKLRVAKSRTLAQDAIREVLKQRDGGTMIDAAMRRIDTALTQTRNDLRPVDFRESIRNIDSLHNAQQPFRERVKAALHTCTDRIPKENVSLRQATILFMQSVGSMRAAEQGYLANELMRIISAADTSTTANGIVWAEDPSMAQTNPIRVEITRSSREDVTALFHFLGAQGAPTSGSINYEGIVRLAEDWQKLDGQNKVPKQLSPSLQALQVFFSELNSARSALAGIGFVRGNLTEQNADGLVMTSGLNLADEAAFAGRHDKVFVTALKNITSQSFENELTEFVVDPPLSRSSARTITAAHCPFYMGGQPSINALHDLYQEISTRLAHDQMTAEKTSKTPTRSVVIPLLGVDPIHRYPARKGLAVMADEVMKMRNRFPDIFFKILLPDGVTDEEMVTLLKNEESKQAKAPV